MPGLRELSLAELREIVTDPDELAKGALLLDDHLLEHFARHENKIFADARGSALSPYKVQVVFDANVRARCSCPASRTRPYCKHAAALLIAWSQAPESFAMADAPAFTDPKKRTVKKGKVDTRELLGRGVEQAGTLARELAVSGVASLGPDRIEQILGLSEALRENRLRRLAGRTISLAGMAERAAYDTDRFDATDYAALLADIVLTVRKLEKHLAGEPLEDRHVEELIGKTWTKKDRRPVEGLELLEYAYLVRTTPEEFLIRESRFLDLAGGEHWSEKQILPAMLVRTTKAKPSHAGKVLHGAAGTVYPSYAPRRLSLTANGDVRPQSQDDLRSLLDRSLASVEAALAAYQERRRDVFAPDVMPAALRVDTVLAQSGRTMVVDARDSALFLPEDAAVEEMLAGALAEAKLRALIGDVVLDAALPTLIPLAAVVESASGLELKALVSGDIAMVLGTRKVRVADRSGPRSRWVATARAVGASRPAIALGEVREELASLLVGGLSTMVPRAVDPISARLRELSLARPADALDAAARKPDPADRLDDFVRVFQVLGVALTRLAGAAQVDRAELVPVPTHESVYVKRRDELVPPKEISSLSAEGKLHRYEAATLYAAWYARLPPEELAERVYPTWADGSAAPFVARAFAGDPDGAVRAARRVLELEHGRGLTSGGKVAKLTAVRVLEGAATRSAEAALHEVQHSKLDAVVRSMARRALSRMLAKRGQPVPPPEQERFIALRQRMLVANRSDDRITAMNEMVDGGMIEAIPYLRASMVGDVSSSVREAAALGLGRLGDVDSLHTFLRMLRRRYEAGEPDEPRIGAYGIGALGDVRGLDELVDAWSEGWRPRIIAEALRRMGSGALGPLLARVESRPDLAKRKAALDVFEEAPAPEVTALLLSRLEQLRGAPDFISRATVLMTLASVHEATRLEVGKRVLEIAPEISARGASKEAKALLRKATG